VCASLSRRGGAWFVFTSWDRERSPPGYPPPFANHEPLLWAAGFSVHACDVQSGAEERRRAIYEHALAEQDELVRERVRRASGGSCSRRGRHSAWRMVSIICPSAAASWSSPSVSRAVRVAAGSMGFL
jgi:hypothetical protein